MAIPSPLAAEAAHESRLWLSEFLGGNDGLVEALFPYADVLRHAVEERERIASLDKQPDEDPGFEELRIADGPALPVESLIESNDAMRAFLRPVSGVVLTDAALEEMRAILQIAGVRSVSEPLRTSRLSCVEPNVSNGPADLRDGESTREYRERTGTDPVGDAVHHPKHYNDHPAGIECIDVNEHMTANIAAAVKYVWRAGLKPGEEHDQDLSKAVWYIERERRRVSRPALRTAAYGGGTRDQEHSPSS